MFQSDSDSDSSAAADAQGQALHPSHGHHVVAPDVVEEIEVRDVTKEGCAKATPAQFELLRVLGQGSFGKVRKKIYLYLNGLGLGFSSGLHC